MIGDQSSVLNVPWASYATKISIFPSSSTSRTTGAALTESVTPKSTSHISLLVSPSIMLRYEWVEPPESRSETIGVDRCPSPQRSPAFPEITILLEKSATVLANPWAP